MYKKSDIIELENLILVIYSYYSLIQIHFNEFSINGKKKDDSIANIINLAKSEIEEMRSLLFKLNEIKDNDQINYEAVARCLYFLRATVEKDKIYYNRLIWDIATDKIAVGKFSGVFRHFIKKLRITERNFNKVANDYKKLSLNSRELLNKQLLQLGTYLQEFVSFVQIIKIMLNYIEKEQLFTKNLEPVLVRNPGLKLVVSN